MCNKSKLHWEKSEKILPKVRILNSTLSNLFCNYFATKIENIGFGNKHESLLCDLNGRVIDLLTIYIIKNELLSYCFNEKHINDKVGAGPEKINLKDGDLNKTSFIFLFGNVSFSLNNE